MGKIGLIKKPYCCLRQWKSIVRTGTKLQSMLVQSQKRNASFIFSVFLWRMACWKILKFQGCLCHPTRQIEMIMEDFIQLQMEIQQVFLFIYGSHPSSNLDAFLTFYSFSFSKIHFRFLPTRWWFWKQVPFCKFWESSHVPGRWLFPSLHMVLYLHIIILQHMNSRCTFLSTLIEQDYLTLYLFALNKHPQYREQWKVSFGKWKCLKQMQIDYVIRIKILIELPLL